MGRNLFWAVLLASLFIVYSQDQSFNDNSILTPLQYNTNWMSRIDNNKRITAITIPGTHDAAALHGGDLAICQAWSVTDQLKAGIRYLDLRVKDNLKIFHGEMSQHTTFTEVLNSVQNFLNQHKSEAVLIRVKPEGITNKNKVQVKVQDVITLRDNIWTKSNVPTMGEARGKVILLQKNEFKLGIPTYGTDKSGDHKVSDYDKKKEKIIEHLQEAKKLSCTKTKASDEVIVSYSSGTGAESGQLWKTPKSVAKHINPWLNYHLSTLEGPCFGVIAMDFPGIDLIDSVIHLNAIQ